MTRCHVPEKAMREAWAKRHHAKTEWRNYYRAVLHIGFELIRENRENTHV